MVVEHLAEPTPSTIAADTAKIAETAKAKFEASMAKNAIETPEPRMVPPEVIWDEGRRQKDAALAREAAKKAKETPAKDEAPARRDDGTFAPKAKPAEATKEDQDAEVADEDFERAHAALVRSGFRKKELDGMDREEVVKRGLKRARALAADDEAHLLAKSLRGTKPEGTKSGDAEQAAKPKLRELPDRKAIQARLTEKLGLDEAGASTLAETIDEYAAIHGERMAEPLRQKLAEMEQAVAQGAERGIQHSLVKAQAALAESIPDLLDPDTFAQVTEAMDTLTPAEIARYGRIADPDQRFQVAMRDASQRLGLVTEESGGKSERRSPEAEARRHQRPTVDGKAKNMPVTPTEEAYARFTDSLDKHGITL